MVALGRYNGAEILDDLEGRENKPTIVIFQGVS
jgi:hypothetical protein